MLTSNVIFKKKQQLRVIKQTPGYLREHFPLQEKKKLLAKIVTKFCRCLKIKGILEFIIYFCNHEDIFVIR